MFKKYTELEVSQMPPLVWAYIGDSVFEIFIRNKMIESGFPSNTKLHKMTTMYVKASAQAKMYDFLINQLSEDEIIIAKRGRNANSNTIPKNASVIEYKKATGLEALLGYLYLKGSKVRLEELLDCIYTNFKID